MPVRTLHEVVSLEDEMFRADDAQGFVSSTSLVGYAELEEATAAIANFDPGEVRREMDFTVVPTEVKIVVNHFTNNVKNVIQDGIYSHRLVEDFIIRQEAISPGFAKKLKWCFRDLWLSFERQLIVDDRAFDAMFDRLSQGLVTTGAKNALKMLMAHLFEKCDIFKRTEEEGPYVDADA